MGHLVDAVKATCHDSQIAKSITCGRTKCAAIVKNVLGEQSREELCELLRRETFSLLVDMPTDRGTIKRLSLVARVVNQDGDVVDASLALVPVGDASDSTLYEHLKAVFNAANIPYKNNMTGFAANSANVMRGPITQLRLSRRRTFRAFSL